MTSFRPESSKINSQTVLLYQALGSNYNCFYLFSF